MRLHCGLRDDERRGNLRVGHTCGKQPEHLELALGQVRKRAAVTGHRCGKPAGHLFEESLGDRGRQLRVTRGDGSHRAHQLIDRRVFEQNIYFR